MEDQGMVQIGSVVAPVGTTILITILAGGNVSSVSGLEEPNEHTGRVALAAAIRYHADTSAAATRDAGLPHAVEILLGVVAAATFVFAVVKKWPALRKWLGSRGVALRVWWVGRRATWHHGWQTARRQRVWRGVRAGADLGDEEEGAGMGRRDFSLKNMDTGNIANNY